jgi:hypothetical protein
LGDKVQALFSDMIYRVKVVDDAGHAVPWATLWLGQNSRAGRAQR